MHSHWRDCKAWRDFGQRLNTTSNEACKLYDASVTQYVGWYDDDSVGGIEKSLEDTLNADPNFVMGHVIKNGLELLGTGTSTRINSQLGKDIYEMAVIADGQKDISLAEKKHVYAVKLWSEGMMVSAANVWEEVLLDNPRDILAIKFAHDTYFYLGMALPMRDSLGRTLPKWKPEMPLYGYLLGMYSFGLEESNIYPEAEKYARRGLEVNPKDAWSTHTMAHVTEMQGRQQEGIAFMSSTEKNWSTCGMLACHNYWHWAVHLIESGDFEGALGIYDSYVGKMANSSGMPLDTVDACSLLMRLEMNGAKVGGRWNDLFETLRPHLDDHVLNFNDNHILMACLGANQKQAAQQMMDSIRNWIASARGTQVDIAKEVGVAICEAFLAYDDKDFAKSVDLLYPLRYQIWKIGGSHAQRDVYNLFLIDAALKSNKTEHHKLARYLLTERKSIKSCSPMTDRFMQRAMALHAD